MQARDDLRAKQQELLRKTEELKEKEQTISILQEEVRPPISTAPPPPPSLTSLQPHDKGTRDSNRTPRAVHVNAHVGVMTLLATSWRHVCQLDCPGFARVLRATLFSLQPRSRSGSRS